MLLIFDVCPFNVTLHENTFGYDEIILVKNAFSKTVVLKSENAELPLHINYCHYTNEKNVVL